MAKYHISPSTGDPGLCSAKPGNCPYGHNVEHFTSPGAARLAYEKILADVEAPTLENNTLRFYDYIRPNDLDAMVNSVARVFKFKPGARIKVKDSSGYGLGVHHISFDSATQEFTFTKTAWKLTEVLHKNKSLSEVLRFVADTEGYSDENYYPVDWDS